MFLLLKETGRQSRYVTYYTADYDSTKRQMLQRLIPINDASPHTICQDYGNVERRGREIENHPRERKGRKQEPVESVSVTTNLKTNLKVRKFHTSIILV